MAYSNRFRVTALAAAIGALGSVAPAHGFEYTNDDFRLQVDSTFSLGASWRASDVDYRNVGLQNALAAQANGDNPSGQSHKHGSSTSDDGDLMWKKGSTFSEVAKLTVDMELNYRNFGAFIRGKTFYDNRIVNGDGVTDLPEYYWQDDQGRNRSPDQSSGASGDILDAFVWGDWDLNGRPLNVRFGKQVINWGEGLLFANGINSINPVDVSALLAPGSEVKDALIPLNSLYGSVGLTNALSLEAFMLFDWRETELPNCGTFFSQSDLVGPGCGAGFVPSGMESSFPGAELFTLPRGEDQRPDSDGQYGVAARYFVESIETEFGVYYTNLHSNLPVISGHTPDVSLLNPALTSLEQARAFLTSLPAGPTPPASFGNPLATTALLPYGDYFVEYPEDIQMFGVSFSTSQDLGLPGGATAISGEISMRKDQPFALEDGDTLAGAVGLPSLACWDAPRAYDCYSAYEPGEYKAGYLQKDYFQAEMVFIHFFDQILGASRWTAVVDIAGSYLDMPGKTQALLNSNYNATLNHPWIPDVPYTVPGHAIYSGVPFQTFIDGIWAATGNLTVAPEGDDYFPTSGAWGYKLRFSGDYEDVFAGINLRPTISFSHDVDGTTPTPIANFLEDRKAIGLSLEAVYLNDYSVNIGYTDFYGAEPYNSLADRDYYSLSTTISF